MREEKPVELMTDAEREAYYIARHKALLAGDDGVLPDGRTCAQARAEYEALCAADDSLTKGDASFAEVADAIAGEDELPPGVVAAELTSVEGDELPNARCCG